MNAAIGAEAALFPEKEYISGIFVAVQVESVCRISEISTRSRQVAAGLAKLGYGPGQVLQARHDQRESEV
jgi:hypothetical protein